MKLEFLYKKVWGKQRFYPLSNDAIILCELIDCQCLTRAQYDKCKDAGWHVECKMETVEI